MIVFLAHISEAQLDEKLPGYMETTIFIKIIGGRFDRLISGDREDQNNTCSLFSPNKRNHSSGSVSSNIYFLIQVLIFEKRKYLKYP